MSNPGIRASWTVWTIALASAALAHGQPSASEPVKRTQRTGVVRAKTSKLQIENRYELDKLGLIPPGYTYTVRGREEGGRSVVSEVLLTSPDGSKTIRMKRVEDHLPVRTTSAEVTIGVGATARTVRPNPNLGLEAGIGADARRHKTPGLYSVRGWSIDIEEGGRVDRSLLLDGVRAAIKRRGPFEWVTAIYAAQGRIVIEEGTSAGSQRYVPKHFRPLRIDDGLWLPAFARGRDPVTKTGTVRAKTTPSRVENRHELNLHGLIPTGYAYVLTGREGADRFDVDHIALTSPDGRRTIQMRRFDDIAVVRNVDAGLQVKDGSSPRALRKNPNRRLEAGLAADARQHDSPGSYRLQGWAIDEEGPNGVQRSLLLDGVRAQIKRGRPVWLKARYGPEGGIVVDGGQGARRLSWKPKRLRLLRGSGTPLPAFAPGDERRGLTATIRAAGE